MAKTKTTKTSNDAPKSRPPLTPEAKKSELMNLAMGLAEKKLRDGTASSQLICHFLKLAADEERDEIEKDVLKEQRSLYAAKRKNLESQDMRDEKYQEVIDAMRNYKGYGDPDVYD